MPIARVDKSNQQLTPLFITASPKLVGVDAGIEEHDVFSRSSSGGSGITSETSGPQTPAHPGAGVPLDLQSAVNLLQRYDASSASASQRAVKLPPPLSLPPQQDPLAGPNSSFVTQSVPEPSTFSDDTRPQRRQSSMERSVSSASSDSPSSARQSPLLRRDIEAMFLDDPLITGPSSAPALESPIRSSPRPRRMASADHTAMKPPLKRARSRHTSKAGADHGFGGARLGNLSFSSLSLSSLELPKALAPSNASLSPASELPAREVIMTPTTEEYRFFAHHEPDIEEDEVSDPSPPPEEDVPTEGAVASDSEDGGLALYKIGSTSTHRRNSSFASGPTTRLPRRRRPSVHSIDGEGDESAEQDLSNSSSLPPDEPVVVPATPSPSRTVFKANSGLQVISKSDALATQQTPSPHSSPHSRAPSPVSLDHVGPLDPRAYSARSRFRNIHSFQIEEEDAGQGAYGLVKQARELGPSGQPRGPELIIKYIIKQRILADCWKKHKLLGPLPVEIHVLDHLRRTPTATFLPGAPISAESTGHPNICAMLDFFEDAEHYYMVMPRFGEGEDLFDYVEAAPDGLPAHAMIDIFGQIADAICFLHSVGIVHRDIKDENVILDGQGRVQLIDFGSAAYVREGRKFDTFSGTLDFAAPEVLRGERYEARETDVWALGVLGYVLLCGECPFWNSEEAMAGLAPGSRPRIALEAKRSGAPEAVDLLLTCLAVEAAERPCARDICRHAAFDHLSGWRGHLGWQSNDATPRGG